MHGPFQAAWEGAWVVLELIAPQITAWACIFPCVFAHWATESPQPLQLLIILIRKNEHMHGPFQAAWEGAWVVLEF